MGSPHFSSHFIFVYLNFSFNIRASGFRFIFFFCYSSSSWVLFESSILSTKILLKFECHSHASHKMEENYTSVYQKRTHVFFFLLIELFCWTKPKKKVEIKGFKKMRQKNVATNNKSSRAQTQTKDNFWIEMNDKTTMSLQMTENNTRELHLLYAE